jgi:hypothetical protein
MAGPLRRLAFSVGIATALAIPAAASAQEASPGAPPAAPAAPPSLASTELSPGVSFQITQLKRLPDKGVTELRFAVVNASEADTSLKELGLAGVYNLDNIYLIDFASKKQYDIGQAAKCLCSTFRDGSGGVVRAGERREFWAWYAPLSAAIKQVAIQIEDQPPLTNVPVQ